MYIKILPSRETEKIKERTTGYSYYYPSEIRKKVIIVDYKKEKMGFIINNHYGGDRIFHIKHILVVDPGYERYDWKRGLEDRQMHLLGIIPAAGPFMANSIETLGEIPARRVISGNTTYYGKPYEFPNSQKIYEMLERADALNALKREKIVISIDRKDVYFIVTEHYGYTASGIAKFAILYYHEKGTTRKFKTPFPLYSVPLHARLVLNYKYGFIRNAKEARDFIDWHIKNSLLEAIHE